MELSREWTKRSGHQGTVVPTYEVRPKKATGPLPVALVVQEAFGVDDHIQDVADRFATAGYFAVAPDLFARGGERPPSLTPARMEQFKLFMEQLPPGAWGNAEAREATLAKLPEPQRTPLRETLATLFAGGLRREEYPKDLAAISNALAEGYHRVLAVGFCMGGGLVAQLALIDSKLSAGVIYYGMPPPPEKAGELRCPLMGHFAEEARDPAIGAGARAFLEAARAAGKSFERHEYPGAAHAFNNDTRSAYHPAAARQAWARTLAFFAQHAG